MRIVSNKWLRTILLSGIYLLGVFGIVASGGGGGGGNDDISVSFPNPTLPASARILDATNATDTANTAVEFLFVGASFTDYLKPALVTTPSVPETISQFIEEIIKRHENSKSLVKLKTHDISHIFCVFGSAVNEFSGTESEEIGTITFTNCDLSGVLLSGTLSYDVWWDDFSDNYDFRFGSNLVFDFGTEAATFVMDLIVTGDDVTFDWTHDIIYSLSVVPGDGFLVTTTTTQPWFGNAALIEVYGGQLIVTGASNTRLRITVTAINVADVELDDGSGTFVFHSTILINP